MGTGETCSPSRLGGAVPQTAPIPLATSRYIPRPLNFAAHSPEDKQARQKMPFCAPRTDRTEGTVPVQIGAYARAGSTSGGSRTSQARRITGGLTADSGVPAGVPMGSGPCAEDAVLICPGAASRRGLPYGGSTRFNGDSTRRQGHRGRIAGGAGTAGSSGRLPPCFPEDGAS